MRLAVVSPFLDRRHGTERCVVEQIERLARQPGWEVHVYSQRIEDLAVVRYSRGASPAPSGVIIWHRVCSIPGPHLLRFLWWFAANWLQRRFDVRFRSLRFDLVYSPGINCLDADAISVHIVFHEFVRLAREELGLRHTPFRSWPRALHRKLYYRLIMRLERRVYSNPRVRLAAISPLVVDQLASHFGRNDATIIFYGVQTEVFCPAARLARHVPARQAFHFGAADFVLLLVGNDWKKKGLSCLIEALASCRDLPVFLLVVGSDDPRPYEALVTRRQLKDRVQFAAPSADVAQFYAAADAYVGPSLEDAFALPVLEAMACGLPAIASGQSGVAGIITDGVDGFVLCDPRDAEGLARLIRLLYEQPDLRRAIGERAARTAQRYTWERNAAQTLAFLTAALTDKHASQTRMKNT